MRNVDVVQSRMVVFVRVSGQQMTPVLSAVQVVGDVEVLMPMLQGIMRVVTLGPRHLAHPPSDLLHTEESTVHRTMASGQSDPLYIASE
jgi:hypothetical protein